MAPFRSVARRAISEWCMLIRWHKSKSGRCKRKHKRIERMLSISQAMSTYRIGWRRLAEWRRRGLPCLIGPGRTVLIRESDLRIWIANAERTEVLSQSLIAAERVTRYGRSRERMD